MGTILNAEAYIFPYFIPVTPYIGLPPSYPVKEAIKTLLINNNRTMMTIEYKSFSITDLSYLRYILWIRGMVKKNTTVAAYAGRTAVRSVENHKSMVKYTARIIEKGLYWEKSLLLNIKYPMIIIKIIYQTIARNEGSKRFLEKKRTGR